MKDNYASLPVFSLHEYLVTNNFSCQRFVIFGNFGAYNMGDEAILAGQLEDLRKMKGIRITVISRYPTQVKRLHKVLAISLLSPLSVIKSIIRSHAVIVGGGGLFCKNDRGIRGVVFQLYTLGMFFMLPLLLKKKVFVWGIGIYSDMDRSIAVLCKSLLKHVSLITVRDHASDSLVRKWKVPVLLRKDNSFLMTPLTKDKLMSDPLFKNISISSRKNIGIALKNPSDEKEKRKMISEIRDIITKEYKTTRFWFYHLDTHPQYLSDTEIMNEILAGLDNDVKKNMKYLSMPVNRKPQWLFSTFQLLDGLIALRLHASIFAYRFNLPFVGLTYSEKCTSFLKAIGKKPHNISSLSHTLFSKLIENKLASWKIHHDDKTTDQKGVMYAY